MIMKTVDKIYDNISYPYFFHIYTFYEVSIGFVLLMLFLNRKKFSQSTELFLLKPATFYSPRQLPAKYPRRWRTLLLCSVWEQVWPLRHHHWIWEKSLIFRTRREQLLLLGGASLLYSKSQFSLSFMVIKPWKLHIEHSNVKTIRSSPRSISTCQLNTLLHLHLRPITTLSSWDLTPFLDGKSHLEGGFALRCLQRLSRPNLATQLCHWHDNWSTSGSSIPVLSY